MLNQFDRDVHRPSRSLFDIQSQGRALRNSGLSATVDRDMPYSPDREYISIRDRPSLSSLNKMVINREPDVADAFLAAYAAEQGITVSFSPIRLTPLAAAIRAHVMPEPKPLSRLDAMRLDAMRLDVMRAISDRNKDNFMAGINGKWNPKDKAALRDNWPKELMLPLFTADSDAIDRARRFSHLYTTGPIVNGNNN
jgi:hypothetical protein